ncbi:MAG: dual specificity protein phosphatase family protein [Anaerolineales bacterium]|nr:dual specificity protein phosphatase family protein [Anaerolineales bacterium]
MNTIIEIPFNFSGKIYRSPMPFSLYDSKHDLLGQYTSLDIASVVVLVSEEEISSKSLRDLLQRYEDAGINVIHYPIMDFGTPRDSVKLCDILENVSHSLKNGKNIAVHCHAGIGRTGLFLSLLARKTFLLEGEQAIQWIRRYLPYAVENSVQEAYISNFKL